MLLLPLQFFIVSLSLSPLSTLGLRKDKDRFDTINMTLALTRAFGDFSPKKGCWFIDRICCGFRTLTLIGHPIYFAILLVPGCYPWPSWIKQPVFIWCGSFLTLPSHWLCSTGTLTLTGLSIYLALLSLVLTRLNQATLFVWYGSFLDVTFSAWYRVWRWPFWMLDVSPWPPLALGVYVNSTALGKSLYE